MPAAKPARVQSPSSINTFRQCPRKYYYCYIEKLKTLPNIHLIRGSIVHSVLEDFFKIHPEQLPLDNPDILLHGLVRDYLKERWINSRGELSKIDMTEGQRLFYYEETDQMVVLWLENFIKKIRKEKLDFVSAFKKWTPRREITYTSPIHGVKGIIDAIHEFENEIIVMDYKTSKKDVITDDYRLQLAIYALLYHETHGKLPTKAGINFLKFGERMIDVDATLAQFAAYEIELIHAQTQGKTKEDYPKKVSPLCKWSSGQCDFYDLCFK